MTKQISKRAEGWIDSEKLVGITTGIVNGTVILKSIKNGKETQAVLSLVQATALKNLLAYELAKLEGVIK